MVRASAVRLSGVILAGLLLSGCISTIKQNEVYSAIRGVGFLEADARCIAARAGRRLAIRELRSLQRAATQMDQPVREMTVGQVIDAITNNVEPATLGTIVRLSAECIQSRREGTN